MTRRNTGQGTGFGCIGGGEVEGKRGIGEGGSMMASSGSYQPGNQNAGTSQCSLRRLFKYNFGPLVQCC